MALTEAQIEFLKREIAELEATLSEEKNTAVGLAAKEAKLKEKEKFYKGQFDLYNSIIVSYEKEIEGMTGQYVVAPITEQDLIDHARETGRLYRGLESTKPRVIQQFNGGPLGQKSLYELSNFTPLLHVISTFLNGEDGGPSFTPTTLRDPYTAGAASFTADDELDPNTWYLLGKDTLVRVGSVTYVPPMATGSCAGETPPGSGTTQALCVANGGVWTPGPPTVEYWIGNITQRYFLSGLDVNIAASETIETWGGYSNTERTNKVATSTTQRFFNVLLGHLQNYMTIWYNLLGMEKGALSRNQDENLNLSDRQTTFDLFSYVSTYIATYPLQDGTPGIDQLQSQIAARQSFIPGRVTTATNAKKLYYGDRLTFTNLRVDTQSGSLSRLLFVREDLQPSFPLSGNPNTADRIRKLKALLAEQ